jgi:hypothetical protein
MLAISIVNDQSSFPIISHFGTQRPHLERSRLQPVCHSHPIRSLPSGVLLAWPTRLLPQDGLKNTCPPATLIISTLPSYFLPPLCILHVPCVSHSPHAKNRCDSMGPSAGTEVRLAGKGGGVRTHQTQHVAVVMSRSNVHWANTYWKGLSVWKGIAQIEYSEKRLFS